MTSGPAGTSLSKLGRARCLGIVGPNGSREVYFASPGRRRRPPKLGSIRVSGKIGSLLELGSDFHPELTGRENGDSERDHCRVDSPRGGARMEEIVDFAELRDFIDSPVRVYSSECCCASGFQSRSTLIQRFS